MFFGRKKTFFGRDIMSYFTQTLFSSGFDYRLLPTLFFTDSTRSGLSFDISCSGGLTAET
jgi:hypothetical protein